jgi:preprotein translocase subunit SecD
VRAHVLVAPLVAMVLAAGCSGDSGSIGSADSGTPTGAAAALQVRPVESIVVPAMGMYDQVAPTCGAGASSPCTDAQLLDPTGITVQASDGTRAVLGVLVIDGSNVASATASDRGDGSWVVNVTLDPEGSKAFATATSDAVDAPPPGNELAIVADGSLVSLPVVQVPIDSGQVVVSGRFTEQQAADLAARLGGS